MEVVKMVEKEYESKIDKERKEEEDKPIYFCHV
jgi:hypothetical protein